VLLVKDAGFAIALNRGSFSASNNGLLVYGALEDSEPVWFDRLGKPQGTAGPRGSYSQIMLSSDDTRATVERPDPRTGANDVVVADLERGGLQERITTNPSSESHAIWMPTTDLIVYAANRAGGIYDLFAKPGSSAGDEQLLLHSPETKFPTGGSPDGRTLLFESTDTATAKSSLWALPLGDKHPYRLLLSDFNETQARISPDGRWIAYTTDKDGAFEVYVVNAAEVLVSVGEGPRRTAMSSVRVSTGGGSQPLWRRDGKAPELYYMAPDRRLMMVSVVSGSRLSATAPQALFSTHVANTANSYQHYAAARDGQRFLVLVRSEQTAATIVANWTSMIPAGK
jgi:hypothetical protein